MEQVPLDSVLLRKTEFGDYDYILTYFTKEFGNVSVIAKNAKKSKKRFSGKLELYTLSKIIYSSSKRGGMPVLTEVILEDPFEKIRQDIFKLAFASYWAEIITNWVWANTPQERIYNLLVFLLGVLNKDKISPQAANLYFQVYFLKFSGFDPMLSSCASCGKEMDKNMKTFKFRFDKGGILCCKCSDFFNGSLSAANVKQLLWIRENQFETASKLRFSVKNIKDCTRFLSGFLSYSTGKEFNSQRIIHCLEAKAL
ncbi:MAG: DNA repair protein RecO [Desulforegulaceae bacterium]|nr:DNA repair protein RecO [Desulforegulaceae bacterium]